MGSCSQRGGQSSLANASRAGLVIAAQQGLEFRQVPDPLDFLPQIRRDQLEAPLQGFENGLLVAH